MGYKSPDGQVGVRNFLGVLSTVPCANQAAEDIAAVAGLHLPAVEDLEAIESAFVEHAASYAGRKGISYTAWREQGVPAAVLSKAGIPRTRAS